MPAIEEETENELGSGLDPAELNARVEHSRIAGEYYRDLSFNYPEYERTRMWPEHPFPNEKHTYTDPS